MGFINQRSHHWGGPHCMLNLHEDFQSYGPTNSSKRDEITSYNQWIGLRENPQETIEFPMKYGAFL